MVDRDLAQIYGLPTKAFNQAVKRNRQLFPKDLMFRLTQEEAKALQASRSQTVISNQKRRTPLPAARIHRIRCIDGRQYPIGRA